MIRTILFVLVALFLTGAVATYAAKKQKAHLTLISAYNKQINDKEQSNPPMTGDHFIICWNDTNYPETFFWRGRGGWLSCKIEKVHKNKAGVYEPVGESTGEIHKGDILMLSPVTGGRFPIPKEIPDHAKNTLFYKTGGSGWLSLPIKTISKK